MPFVMAKVTPCATSFLRAIIIQSNLSFMCLMSILFFLNELIDFLSLMTIVSFNWLGNYALFIIIYVRINYCFIFMHM